MRHATKKLKFDTGAKEAKSSSNPTGNSKILTRLAPLAPVSRFGKTQSIIDKLEALSKQKCPLLV